MSLDGYTAGPEQSTKEPLGIGASDCTSGWSRWRRGARLMGSRVER